MFKEKIYLLLFPLLFLSCAAGSPGGEVEDDEDWGYVENGNLNLKITQNPQGYDEYEFWYKLSQSGDLYVTIDGSEPSDSNYEYHFNFDYNEGVSSLDSTEDIERCWEVRIRALGIASDFDQDMIYVPPKAPPGTTIEFDDTIRYETKLIDSVSEASAQPVFDTIPEWGTAECLGSWTYSTGGQESYYYMIAGTSGILRTERVSSNSGSFIARTMDGTELNDGDQITEGTEFYFHGIQGSVYGNGTLYHFDFWIEEE